MIVVEQQLHGYRQGHELLSASVQLPPRDQDLVDRLSDVAGPLGPSERFAPYLTCYPLPSGSRYVLARTWQDLAAPRAGCVRTRSLLVPISDWTGLEDPGALAEAATEAGWTRQAETIRIDVRPARPLPPVEGSGTELLEALFLEDRLPVAVFGADMPEVIALRLQTAIWPSLRCRFSVSTFCNSPRTIAKRSFDLVFAPVEARSRFSDWAGRRVDGRRSAAARHRWTASLAERVLRAPRPSLRSLDVIGEMAQDELGSEDALRVSLLWDELEGKVGSDPHAALGLLDIANTRAKSEDLVRNLEPALVQAVTMAIATMPTVEAWRFLQTLMGKLGKTRLRLSAAISIMRSAGALASRRPADAVAALAVLLAQDVRHLLVAAIGEGLGRSLSDDAVRSLTALKPIRLLRLAVASPTFAGAVLRRDAALYGALAAGLDDAAPDLRRKARRLLLRHLTDDRHADVFRALVAGMSSDELVDAAARLARANGLGAGRLDQAIVKEAKRAGGAATVRELVASIERSPAVDAMLADLVEPTAADVQWVLDRVSLAADLRRSLLLKQIGAASRDQLQTILADPGTLRRTLQAIGPLDGSTTKALERIAEQVPMGDGDLVDLVLRLLPKFKGRRAAELAARGLDAALAIELGTFRDRGVAILLEAVGKAVKGNGVIRKGLSAGVSSDLASRNLVLFDASPQAVRFRFLEEPEALSEAIIERRTLDLTYEGAEAAGRLLWDSRTVDHRAFVQASAALLPFALQERRRPAAALVAAAFPPVYQALQNERLPDFLSLIFLFLDWDRCKSAREELAEAFSRSDWRATDVALAAARADDPERILRQVARRCGGAAVLAAIKREIDGIPQPWRQKVQLTLGELDDRDQPPS